MCRLHMIRMLHMIKKFEQKIDYGEKYIFAKFLVKLEK